MKGLDLCCGTDGCSMGYHQAGFTMVRVGYRASEKLSFEFNVWLLQAGDLEPPDLLGPGFPGSDKYLFLFPRRFAELVSAGSDFEIFSGSQIENIELHFFLLI